MIKHRCTGMVTLIAGAALLASATAMAGEADAAKAPKKDKARIEAAGPPYCLQVDRIRETEIVDDSTILFHMRSGKTYRNKLPYECNGLRFEDGFAYATSINRLCSVDTITVLRRGTTCGLGKFELIQPTDNDNGDDEFEENGDG